MFNTKFIQIANGLKEGDRVLLSPPFDSQEKDLEGAVLADNEKAKFATNRPSGSTKPTPETLPGQPGVGPVAAGGPPNSEPALAAAGQESGKRGSFNREEFMKQFDKNGDGTIDDSEREAMQAAMAARFGGGPPDASGGAPKGMPNREEMLKRFDKNGDGKLDDEERAAMRASMGGGRRGQGGGQDGPAATATGGQAERPNGQRRGASDQRPGSNP